MWIIWSYHGKCFREIAVVRELGWSTSDVARCVRNTVVTAILRAELQHPRRILRNWRFFGLQRTIAQAVYVLGGDFGDSCFGGRWTNQFIERWRGGGRRIGHGSKQFVVNMVKHFLVATCQRYNFRMESTSNLLTIYRAVFSIAFYCTMSARWSDFFYSLRRDID